MEVSPPQLHLGHISSVRAVGMLESACVASHAWRVLQPSVHGHDSLILSAPMLLWIRQIHSKENRLLRQEFWQARDRATETHILVTKLAVQKIVHLQRYCSAPLRKVKRQAGI